MPLQSHIAAEDERNGYASQRTKKVRLIRDVVSAPEPVDGHISNNEDEDNHEAQQPG